ncbi:MAG: hypothetical protein MK078_12650 [Crocinitomicaceae bacterium]|nr:hypothetical protein [Crocinitomicaceae bacterium]
MGKEFKNIEDLYTSTLADEQVAVPASIKAGIDKGIASGKWWRLGALFFLLIGLSVGAFYIFGPDKTGNEIAKNTNSLHVQENISKNQNSITGSPETETNSTSVSYTEEDDNNMMSATSIDEGSALTNRTENISTTNSTSSSTSSTISTASSRTQNTSTENSETSSSNLSSEPPNTMNSTPPVNNEELIKEAMSMNTDNINSTENPSTSENTGTRNNETNNTLNLSTNEGSNTFITKEKDMSKMGILPIQNLPARYDKINISYTPPSIDPKPAKREINGFWMVHGGLGYMVNKAVLSNEFQATGSDAVGTYDERNTLGINLSGGYYFGKKVGVKTGFSTYQLKEDFSYSESEWQHTTDSTYVADWDYILDSTGTAIDSTDVGYYVSSLDSNYVNIANFNGTNSLRVISIPFYLSYMFKVKDFMIEPEIYGSYNLIRNQTGTIAPNGVSINYDQNSPVYKRSFFSLGVGLNLHYSLGNHVLLSGYGRLQRPMGNLFMGSFSKTLTTYSFGGGISFIF